MNDTSTLEVAKTEEQLSLESDICDCQEQSQELIMDKLASVSYVAMLSVVAYGLVALSVLVA